MSRTRTLAQLRTGVSDRADVTVATSGVRNTESIVDARINRAIQRWLNIVAESGDDTNLVTTRTTTSTSATRDAANWAPNMYVDQPSTLLFVRGLDVWDGNTPIAMMPLDESERNDAHDDWLQSGGTGMPVFYRLGGTRTSGAKLIQIFPWADAVYTIDIRYIPAHVDLTTGTDTIDFIAGGEEWVVNDAAMQTLLADGLAGEASYGAMMQMNSKLEQELRFITACRASIRRVDTRGRRDVLRRMNGYRRPA